MNNAMQLKAIIKNMAKSKNISAQIILQNYMLERLLERISLSLYQSNFILKGGFLIAAMVGLDARATMDMESRSIKVLAYNLETIIAEKLETVLSRGDQNTRPRDYYDIYVIRQLQWQNIDLAALKLALKETCRSRGSLAVIDHYEETLTAIQKSGAMDKFWQDYQAQFDYAKDIEYKDICLTIREILNEIFG